MIASDILFYELVSSQSAYSMLIQSKLCDDRIILKCIINGIMNLRMLDLSRKDAIEKAFCNLNIQNTTRQSDGASTTTASVVKLILGIRWPGY